MHTHSHTMRREGGCLLCHRLHFRTVPPPLGASRVNNCQLCKHSASVFEITCGKTNISNWSLPPITTSLRSCVDDGGNERVRACDHRNGNASKPRAHGEIHSIYTLHYAHRTLLAERNELMMYANVQHIHVIQFKFLHLSSDRRSSGNGERHFVCQSIMPESYFAYLRRNWIPYM